MLYKTVNKSNNIIDLRSFSETQSLRLIQLKRELKEEFNELIAEIYSDTDLTINWHVNSILSRHNSSSQVFNNVIILILAKEILNNKNYNTIIVPNKALKIVLKRFIKENRLSTRIVFVSSFREKIKNTLRLPLCMIENSVVILKFIVNKKASRAREFKRKSNLTLIDIYLENIMLQAKGFHDRYYTGMLNYLTKDMKKTIYYLPTFVTKSKLSANLKKLSKYKEQFIYKFDFLKLSDYLFALLNPLYIKRINFEKYIFHGVNIGAILKNDFSRNLSTRGTFEAILNYRFIRRLKEQNVKLRLFVNWFENQNTGRGYVKGIHDYYPNVHTIGYQGFFNSEDYFIHLTPTNYEIKYKVIPDEVALVGKGLLINYAKIDVKKLVVAPSFRFSEVHRRDISANFKNMVLVSLPSNYKVSFEILSMVIQVYRSFEEKNIYFQIKPHPDMNNNRVQKYLGPHRNNLEIVNGKFSEIIISAGLFIGNASATCMEALANGVPVIIISSKHELTYNPIPESVSKDIWDICGSSNDLRRLINKFLFVMDQEELSNRLEKFNSVKNEFFEPVSKESVQQFLKL